MAIIHNYAPENDHFLKMFENIKMIYDDLLDFGVGNTKRMHTFIVIKDHKTLMKDNVRREYWEKDAE